MSSNRDVAASSLRISVRSGLSGVAVTGAPVLSIVDCKEMLH